MANHVVACPSCGTRNRVPAVAKGVPQCAHCHRPLPWIADADDQSFDEVVNTAGVPVLLDLWAPWCGPCRQVSPALERLATERAGKLKLVKVNVDISPLVQARFQVQSIPTLMVFRKGQQVARQSGAMPLNHLRTWLDRAVG
ncbi:thioredoxin [Raineyella antarctica]|uniref:Thioredoxin n=1 Tax=Raineyella antarctica TaxID=1577474 RepID=A0A1G6GEM3_9ACTN|nr:thioredoxin [Raineyella antarctica]SDB80414.1 thioredoxin [Raineyella antarctica]